MPPRTAGRRCPAPGCPTILTGGERRCAKHAREYEQQRGTRQQRGYDTNHDRLRAHHQARIDRGEDVRCVTCDVRLTGRAWQLGHDHERGFGYIGPQCVPCNTADGGRRGAQTSNAKT